MFNRALILFVATLAFADTTQELIDVFGSMASALSEDNPAVFLRAIDPSAPGYAALARNVNALANQNELTCSIEIVKQEGDGRAQAVRLRGGSAGTVVTPFAVPWTSGSCERTTNITLSAKTPTMARIASTIVAV